jgi:hypothetical protein
MTDAILQTLDIECSRDAEILRIISEVRDVFENHFDRNWFSLLIDDMPIDPGMVREIRRLVSLKNIFPGEEWQIWQGVQALSDFVLLVKRFLLPMLKERLGISSLIPARRVGDPTQLIIRKFVAFTFPYNLERLKVLTEKLRAHLVFHYPFLH